MSLSETEKEVRYSGIPAVPPSSTVLKLAKVASALIESPINWVLCHIYPTGGSTIGYHSDREALHTYVVSMSIGATRKFRFRKRGATKGFEYQLDLADGDVLVMKPGCQSKYAHSLIKEAKVKDPRINLTFRQ